VVHIFDLALLVGHQAEQVLALLPEQLAQSVQLALPVQPA
jgi:hypothetical protein